MDDGSARRALAATFNEDAELYDRLRPGYPHELFADLASLADVGAGSRLLEIGPGTGQATRMLAELGCSIVAVEPGAELARVARRRLGDLPQVRVVRVSFEELELSPTPFDAIAAFTAWHWLEPAVRVRKAAAALRPGGALVTVATHHVAGGTQGFFVDVQDCYERWDPSTPPRQRLLAADDVPQAADEVDDSDLFDSPAFRRYEWEASYGTARYLDLLRTYSGHRRLSADRRERLLDCIGQLIDHHYGGQIVKRYLNELRVVPRRSVRRGDAER